MFLSLPYYIPILMLIPISLIGIGGYGILRNKNHAIMILVSIEILLLGTILLLLMNSINFDDSVPQTFSIFIITLAGVESAIGLGLIVSYYKVFKTISLSDN